MRKPYEKDWRYSWARLWCDDATRSLFSHISSEGKENIPTDGAVIFAPNHCNTLMDALVILQDWREATLYGARADIFRKPAVSRILRFLKILPLPRVRDGAQAVLNNYKTMEEVVECMDNGMKYCMFCEGTHRPKHSLLPLKKGIVRTALLANERFGSRRPVYIVPVGLEYQDYFRIRTPMSIHYGKAINVTEFISSNQGMREGKIYRSLLGILRQRISSLFTCLPDDETYTGRWMLTKMAGLDFAMTAGDDLISKAEGFENQRKEARLSSWSFGHRWPGLRIVGKCLLGLVFLPLFLFAAITASPMWILSTCISKKIRDKAFVRTAHFGVKFALMPLLLVIWGIVFFLCLPIKAAIVALILFLGSYTVFYETVERGRILLSDIRLFFGHSDLKEFYSQIHDHIIN